ncbi:MAG: DUF4439 domain-containing protein [Candidatus Nanopelagicales bacterium]
MSEALQAALDGEYAAIYAYGRAGARLTTDQDVALNDLATHRLARDQLRAWLMQDGVDPAPPAPAYALPTPVNGNASARSLLATVELRLIPLFTELVGDQRAVPTRLNWSIRAIRNSALRAQAWGASGQAFPWPEGVAAPA